jgi:hypothetical protein
MADTASRVKEPRGRRSRLARTSVLTLVLAAVPALVLLASACGGSSGETGASADSGTADGTAYSACMRANGVPKFPAPRDGAIRARTGAGTDPNTPTFKAAEKACREFMGSGPTPAEQTEDRARNLRYSACMRENGVPKFPDPQFSGGRATLMLDKRLATESPQFKAAERACEKFADE